MATVLSRFIEEIGDEAASKAFGVKLRTVQSWRRGERLPRPRQAALIVKGSGGRVGLAGIYGSGDALATPDRDQGGVQAHAMPVAGSESRTDHDDVDPDEGRIDPDIEGA